MNILHTCPPHPSHVATLPWEIQSHFSTCLFIHTSDYLGYVISEENELQLMYCSLAVYLLLFSASCYLHSHITASGAFYRRNTSPWYGRVAAAACCDMGWISAERGVRCDLSVAKKTGSMYPCGWWSLWILAVMLLAWHCVFVPVCCTLCIYAINERIAVAAHHNALSSGPPTFERMQQSFSQMNNLCISQVSVVTFSDAVAKLYDAVLFPSEVM